MTKSINSVCIKNISQLITLSPLVESKRTNNITESDLGILKNAWLCLKDGKVFSYGTKSPPAKIKNLCDKEFDAEQQIIMPGLIDSHTHPLYAGDRSNEFKYRLDGISYEDIAQQGGGILSTVKSTRNASNEALLKLCLKRVLTFLSFGVSTVEAKSGYGLSVSEELRHLQILKEVKNHTPQTIISTCLPLHAIPPEEKSKLKFIQKMSFDLLPQVKKLDLAKYVDMFIERGYFSTEDCLPFLTQAKKLGFNIRVHADEFSDSDGANIAAQWQASSADHLQHASSKNLAKMAKSKTIATLLPGTSLYTKIPFTNAEKIIKNGCSIAIASDHNPGSCLLSNLPLLSSLAAIHCGLNSAQTIAAITYVPAHSLGLQESKGAIYKGFDGDCVLFPHRTIDQWLAQFGNFKAKKVWIKGQDTKLP